MTRIVCISDTHTMHQAVKIPPCDILVHAGDATRTGRVDELQAFNAWCRRLKKDGVVREVVFVAGNHDILLDATHPLAQRASERVRRMAREALADVVYLQDAEREVLGLRFYGSPWTGRFYNWAFQIDHMIDDLRIFGAVPEDLDVLVTHSPPFQVRDRCPDGREVGSITLLERVERCRPRLHVFGHIHEGHGMTERGRTKFVNAAICTGEGYPTNEPIVVDL